MIYIIYIYIYKIKVFQFYFFKLKNKYIKKELKEYPDIFYLKLIYNKYKNYTIYLL